MPETTKTCGMCLMPIPAQARKCPHCQHFQNKMSLVMFHPGFSVFFGIITMAVMLIFFNRVFGTGKKLPDIL